MGQLNFLTVMCNKCNSVITTLVAPKEYKQLEKGEIQLESSCPGCKVTWYWIRGKVMGQEGTGEVKH